MHVVRALLPAADVHLVPEEEIMASTDEIADYYANLVRVGVALGQEFEFDVRFFWQPAIALTNKKLGAWETQLSAEQDTVGAQMARMTRATYPKVASRLAAHDEETFISLNDVFDEESEDVFIDHYGHITEDGNSTIAAAITRQLVPLLRADDNERSADDRSI